MAGFRTQYTRLNSNSDDPEEDLPPQGFDIAARGFEEIEKGNLLKKRTVCTYWLKLMTVGFQAGSCQLYKYESASARQRVCRRACVELS